MSVRTWLSAVAIFFGWGFVMHATGLLLHEFGGHALTAWFVACGIDDYALTFFGHGQVHRTPCESWTPERVWLVDWSGLVFTTTAGFVALWLAHRKRNWPALWRLLAALVGYFFLLGQLGYATSGGFHDVWDPGRLARWLGAHGAHPLAWVPPMIGYAAAAFFGARLAIDAFRAHFGSKSRLATLGQLAATLGVAGIVYFVAFRVEWQIRTDLAMRGVAAEAERIAIERHTAPPFPIDKLLVVIALAALIAALARPVTTRPKPSAIPPRLGAIVALASAACFLVILVLNLTR